MLCFQVFYMISSYYILFPKLFYCVSLLRISFYSKHHLSKCSLPDNFDDLEIFNWHFSIIIFIFSLVNGRTFMGYLRFYFNHFWVHQFILRYCPDSFFLLILLSCRILYQINFCQKAECQLLLHSLYIHITEDI